MTTSSSLPAAMLTELQGQARVHFTMDLTLGSTTYKFAKYPIVSEANGEYYPYVQKFGSVTRTSSFPSFGLSNVRTTVDIFDEDRDLQKAIGGARNGMIVGSACNIVLRSFYVAEASHYTVLPGIVKDYRLMGDRKWQFVIGVDDRILDSTFNIPHVKIDIWKNMEADLETDGRIYFGKWESTGVTGSSGMVECILVDPEQGLWYVSYGSMDEVKNIYVDGTSDTNFTVLGTRVDGTAPYLKLGRPYTLIQDTNSTLRDSTNTVTCDVIGPELQGDGSGDTSVLTGPADMFRIIMATFVYNDWPIGATQVNAGKYAFFGRTSSPANTPVDDTTVDAVQDWFDDFSIRGAIKLTSNQTPRSFIQTWSETFQIQVGWNSNFDLALILINPFLRDVHESDFIKEEDIQGISMTTLYDETLSRIDVNYLIDDTTGQFTQTAIHTENAMADVKRENTLNMTYLENTKNL